jgi:alpha-beta hydrolase superfamily lysophospholipase
MSTFHWSWLYRLLKKPFFGRCMVLGQNPLSAEKRAEWQPVAVASKSGATVRGLFARSDAKAGPAKATLVLGHPMGKEAKGYFLKNGYTDLLRRGGYHVMVFDLNGFGESSHGNFSYFEDIIAIGNAALALTPELPLGYFGISLGGSWATIAFADKHHPYDFAIVESAGTTLEEFWVRYPVAYLALQVIKWWRPAYVRSLNIGERIKEARHLHSVLFIYPETDEVTPVAMGRRFVANSRVPAELWTLPEGKHAQLMKAPGRAAYEAKILAYFDQAVATHWGLPTPVSQAPRGDMALCPS